MLPGALHQPPVVDVEDVLIIPVAAPRVGEGVPPGVDRGAAREGQGGDPFRQLPVRVPAREGEALPAGHVLRQVHRTAVWQGEGREGAAAARLKAQGGVADAGGVLAPPGRQSDVFLHSILLKVEFLARFRVPAGQVVPVLAGRVRRAGLAAHHLDGIDLLAVLVGHLAAVDASCLRQAEIFLEAAVVERTAADRIRSFDSAVERAAGNWGGLPAPLAPDRDRSVEAAAGDATLITSDSHRAVIAAAGEHNTGGLHLAGVYHGQICVVPKAQETRDGQQIPLHIQGIILIDGHAVQRQLAADVRRRFQVRHVGDGEPALVIQLALHRQRGVLPQRQLTGACFFRVRSLDSRHGTVLIDHQGRTAAVEAYAAASAHGHAAVDYHTVAGVEVHDTLQRQRPALGNGQGKPEI